MDEVCWVIMYLCLVHLLMTFKQEGFSNGDHIRAADLL